MAPRKMKMTDGTVTLDVVASAFYNVWAGRGWVAAPADADTDHHILGLEGDQSVEDYVEARDKMREMIKAAEEQRQQTIADALALHANGGVNDEEPGIPGTGSATMGLADTPAPVSAPPTPSIPSVSASVPSASSAITRTQGGDSTPSGNSSSTGTSGS